MIYSARHNAVVYPPAVSLSFLPGCKVLPDGRQVVPASLTNMQLCRQVGLPVPSLIDIQYDWPIKPGWKPTVQQRRMAAFLTMHQRAFNLSDPRTGKTLAALWAADYLMSRGAVRRALIISPLSTLDDVWASEIFQHFMGRRTAITLYGTRAQRLDMLKTPADFYIVNHDGLQIGCQKGRRGLVLGEFAQALIAAPDIDMIIADEATAYKEHGTLRSRVLASVSAKKPYLWLLTGTPTPNAPTDAWALKKLVSPHQCGSFIAFRDQTMERVSNFKWVPKRDASGTVFRTLQPSIRFSRAECGIIPELHYPPARMVKMSAQQQQAYDAIKKYAHAMITGGEITAANEAVLRLKLIQIGCGAVYGKKGEAHPVDCTPRLEALSEEIGLRKAKFIVFAPFTSAVDVVYNHIRHDFSVERITGNVGRSARQEIFGAFKLGGLAGIIADPGTMAHGLDLTVADTIIWYGPTDRPEVYEQANARINGPAQVHTMRVIRLASTTIEKEIYARLDNKQSMAGAIHKLLEDAK